jgi:hypothetical protein
VAGQELGEITDEAKGALLSLVALAGDEAVFAGLVEDEAAGCAAAWLALGQLEKVFREAVLSAWRARAQGGLPEGLEHLHPSWIAATFAGEPSYLLRYFQGRLPHALGHAVEALMAGAAVEDQDAVMGPQQGHEIEQIALAPLVRLCEGSCGPLAAKLCGLEFEALQVEVTRRGARTLAQSLAGADASIQARAMALAGQPWAAVMAEAWGKSISAEERTAARIHASANVYASARTSAERLLHIGLAALKSELAAEGAGSVSRVAGRLPAELGRRLLSE